MIRLVKGAYWDSEIKRAQIDGLEDFPVYTRKIHTDISYMACARKMLDGGTEIFPQFATHNALTLASIHALAGPDFTIGQYEFQCLHGMGEALYDEVVGPNKLGVPCRIYAPVGTHETLLAYLVRRLLENGANTSFVNKLADPKITTEDLLADPVAEARKLVPLGQAHNKIAAPAAMFGKSRRNAAGLDLSNEQRLASLASALLAGLDVERRATADGAQPDDAARPIINPADFTDQVGSVVDASPDAIEAALVAAEAAAPIWQVTPPAQRAQCLIRAADLLEQRLPHLIGLIVREAGKTILAAIGEVREAIDFLRYYATNITTDFDNATHRPLGIVVAISPWNFPLAIFVGQVAAALAAGNAVLAKPAEETPLIAAEAIRLLREAGIPPGAIALLPGDGSVGAALVADARVRGVIFTGSNPVARAIQAALAQRLTPSGMPIPLIAETGGQNAMLVDSSALLEQAVGDIIASAFDSAGQRCSALRILLVQTDIADALITMLKGAMAELTIGNPDHLASDIGPVISEEAHTNIQAHIADMSQRGFRCFAATLPGEANTGWYIAPTMIEIADPTVLKGEIFGPVLHVVRYAAADRDRMIDAVNALGYGLTFGVHSRIDETITAVTERIHAGNIYVNRNIVGAVVGVQPFGGHGLSGTGPKAGGPLYLQRLLARCPPFDPASAPIGQAQELAGPVGEQNLYRLHPRGIVLCRATDEANAARQVAACEATGNTPLVQCDASPDSPLPETITAVLFEGSSKSLSRLQQTLATRAGPIVPVFTICEGADYPLECLLAEQSICTNTAAAGGNASLMTIG
jgi:RHH-type proline utilization regulon transcriptional repressor/proline dehydrogenase/delta 1-pyrroline-5-carboxylate dehydrogenase